MDRSKGTRGRKVGEGKVALSVTGIAVVLWAVGFGALGAGCALFHNDQPAEQTYPDSEFDELWMKSLSVVGREFPMRTTDKAARTFLSEWRTNLHPFRYSGKRRRVEGRLFEEEEGLWAVELLMRVETNTEIDAPLDIRRASWRRDADDVEGARRLLHLVSVSFDRKSAPGSGSPSSP